MFVTQLKKHKNKFLLGLFITCNIISLSSTAPALANKQQSSKDNSNYGLPIHRRDGGSRSGDGSCLANSESQNLVALIPDRSVGLNAADSPQLFFYVPQVNQSKTIEFVLRDQQDELIYEAFMTTAGKGIMSVEIPEDLQSKQLETEQNYHWYLSVICNPQQRSRDIVVEGWLRQGEVDLAMQQKLAAADTVAQAQMYYQQGFWYDALAVLAEPNAANSDTEAKWAELLSSVGLEEFADAPFVQTNMIETSAAK